MTKDKIREFFDSKFAKLGVTQQQVAGKEGWVCPYNISHLIYENTLDDHTVINLFDEFGYAVAIYNIHGDIYHYFITRDELKDTDYYKKKESDWLLLPREHRDKVEKYMSLMYRLVHEKESVTMIEKKWILMNANTDTTTAPLSLHNKYDIR